MMNTKTELRRMKNKARIYLTCSSTCSPFVFGSIAICMVAIVIYTFHGEEFWRGILTGMMFWFIHNRYMDFNTNKSKALNKEVERNIAWVEVHK